MTTLTDDQIKEIANSNGHPADGVWVGFLEQDVVSFGRAILRVAQAEIEALRAERDKYKIAWQEWSYKTDWVQEQLSTFPLDSLGKHRADIMRKEIETLRSKCAMLQPAVPEAKQGYAVVPVEPTESMVVAGFESWPDRFFSKPEDWEAFEQMTGCQQAAHKARLCYAAMLAAAPQVDDAASTDDTPPPCDKEIHENGTVVAIMDGGKLAMEGIVTEACRREGVPTMDWHYFGGRAMVKTLGDAEKARAALKTAIPRFIDGGQ
ncbi:hypothetical protein [Noviherbaspirillum malthae]|uniref:hypothetical protein n=1 Tax=Noviherbaspirillum malthae TaxID=1260987 RepID=UPI00188FF91D|nr:hypothetical protein [Noviherbaspirillum malthae]